MLFGKRFYDEGMESAIEELSGLPTGRRKIAGRITFF
jgi:hypothetical protein